MPTINEREMTASLLDPTAYPWPVERVDHLETHISHLFFAGERVIKIKRPVNYGFADLTSLESRRRACHDEVRLNRRLTDDIYVDAFPIVRSGSGVRVSEAGIPIEWATVMRRFPADATLDRWLERGELPHELVDRLASRLIPFHEQLPSCDDDADALASVAERIVRENLDQIVAIDSPALFSFEFSLVRQAVAGYLDHHPNAILDRARAGMIREGHGDLKCEHVLLDPPGSLQIFDCVEFSREIRCADVASDLAFLLLDLERLGAAEVAAELVNRYRAADIDLPDEQLALYRVHRALVKVKTSALTHDFGDRVARFDSAREVARWLHLAFASAFRMAPVVIAMTGYSGTGKSVVSQDIALALAAERFSTDLIRRESGADPDRYSPTARLDNYRHLIERAAPTLAGGRPVVLDGAFLREEERELAQSLSNSAGAPLVFVHVTADPDIVEKRIRARTLEQAPSFGSEATLDVFHAQRSQPWVPLPDESNTVTIDTTPEIPASIDALLRALDGAGLIANRLEGSGTND